MEIVRDNFIYAITKIANEPFFYGVWIHSFYTYDLHWDLMFFEKNIFWISFVDQMERNQKWNFLHFSDVDHFEWCLICIVDIDPLFDKLIIGAWSVHYNVISNVIYINQCLKLLSNPLFEVYSIISVYIIVSYYCDSVNNFVIKKNIDFSITITHWLLLCIHWRDVFSIVHQSIFISSSPLL